MDLCIWREVIMTRKYKAIKISDEGFLTNQRDEPIICPIRNASCELKCAWFSAEDRVLRCQDTIIGALKGKPMRSFHLYSGPQVYDLDESLEQHQM